MKRVTFVFIGIIAITTVVLFSQKKIEDRANTFVKVDTNKPNTKGIYK